jgi:hypothetical protein
MRYRLMATYRGAPYEAGVGPADGAVTLFAACPPPEELGFEPAPGHWRKELRLQEVQGVWQSRPVGVFRGERCVVLDDLGDRLHICYLGHDAYRAEELGYWQVDRGVFELVAAREEVLDIVEERTDYPARGYPAPDGFPVSGPLPPAARSGPLPAVRPGPRSGPQPAAGYQSGYDSGGYDASGYQPSGGVALPPPPAGAPPLPLEAEALRAASARDLPAGDGARFLPSGSGNLPAPVPAADGWGPAPRRRRAAGQRLATEQIFRELAGLAAIPPATYALGAEADGAMCLLETAKGFEVFNCAGGARHEVRVFSDEESAYFYLFGVLAAEAVRTGALAPAGAGLPRLR